jgi:20S proteasome alpha/beta subunit
MFIPSPVPMFLTIAAFTALRAIFFASSTVRSFLYSSSSKPYVTTGSGSPVAYGLLEEEYRNDLTVEEAKKIALRAVKAAIVRNIGTGDGINIAIMDKDGFRLLTDE